MEQTYKCAELRPEDRLAIERLLGRKLNPDETVAIVTRENTGPAASRRAQAAERILQLAKGKTTGCMSARDLIEAGRR